MATRKKAPAKTKQAKNTTSRTKAKKAAPEAVKEESKTGTAASKAAAKKAAPEAVKEESKTGTASSRAAAKKTAAKPKKPKPKAKSSTKAAEPKQQAEKPPSSSGKKAGSTSDLFDREPVKELKANGIDLAYQDYGSQDHPAVVLIMGLGGQLVHWPDRLVAGLLEQGYRVIRFDNRDAGASQQIERKGIPWPLPMRMLLARFGMRLKASYSLDHMAADTIGLLDGLGIHKAHLVGMSMGGMIAQSVAIRYGHRLFSLTSIMSNTGHPGLPAPDTEVVRELLTSPPEEKQAAVEAGVRLWTLLGGEHFPPDKEELEKVSALAFDRSQGPEGQLRQLEAIISSPPRNSGLSKVFVPSLVIHGTADRLVRPEGGKQTAECIPSARLEMIEGMGHALQPGVVALILPMLLEHMKSAPK